MVTMITNMVTKYIQPLLDRLGAREFQRIAAVILGVVVLLCGLIIFWQHRSVGSLVRKIDVVNEERDTIRTVLERAQLVRQEQERVNKILSENPNFKIGGYFNEVLARLRLTGKKVTESKAYADRGENYQERSLTASFNDMNMRELVELVDELGKNERIYTKELQINKSKRSPGTVEVTITIGTVMAKTGEQLED